MLSSALGKLSEHQPVEYSIFFSKSPRRMVYRYLEPQDQVRGVGAQALNQSASFEQDISGFAGIALLTRATNTSRFLLSFTLMHYHSLAVVLYERLCCAADSAVKSVQAVRCEHSVVNPMKQT